MPPLFPPHVFQQVQQHVRGPGNSGGVASFLEESDSEEVQDLSSNQNLGNSYGPGGNEDQNLNQNFQNQEQVLLRHYFGNQGL